MRTIDGDDSMQRIFSLLHRHCPVLMRTGGGPLPEERLRRPDLTSAQIERLRRLRESGVKTRDIAKQTGYSRTTINRHLQHP